MKMDYNNYRKCAIAIYRVRVDTSTLLALHSDTLQAARQIIIFPTEAGWRIATALVRVDGKSYYEIIINGIMSEVTRYVFEWRDVVASEVTVEGTRRRRETMFSRGLHLRRVVLVERRTPRARTYASTQARIYSRTHSPRNEREIKRRASALARAALIEFCFIQEVLIIQCLGISAAEYRSPRSVSKHFEKSK